MGELRAPTVGREREVEDLTAAFDRVARGSNERWLVVAPPGVGKSRLLREMSQHVAARSGAVWRSRARPGAVSPFDAHRRPTRISLARRCLRGKRV